MKLICCFGGAQPVSSPPSSYEHATIKDEDAEDQRSLLPPSSEPSPLGLQAIGALRAQCLSIACSASSWAVRLAICASYVAEACDAPLIGLMGATSDADGLTNLVMLSSYGSLSAALPLGEVLPLSQSNAGTDPRGQQPPLALPPWEAPEALRCTPRAQRPSSPDRQTLRQRDAGAQPPAQPGGPRGNRLGRLGSPSNSLLMLCDPAWQRAVGSLRACLPTAGPHRCHVVLVPLYLGPEVVGAMLMALPASDGGSKGHGGGDGGSKASGGGKQQPRGGRCTDGKAAGATTALRDALLHQPGLLEALGACAAECCLGPVLPDVSQVCANCGSVDAAVTLHDLSASLTAALTTSLGADLHVDLGVRLAVLPYKDASHGVLFEDLGKSRGSGVGGAAGAVGTYVHRSASLPYVVQAGTAAASVGSGGSIGRQQQQQLGSYRSARATTASGGGLGGRAVLLHAAATRAAALASGPHTMDDLLRPPSQVSVTEGFGASSARSVGGMRRGAVSMAIAGGFASRTAALVSPQPALKAQIKAATFSLGSTLAAFLMAQHSRSSGSNSGALPPSSGATTGTLTTTTGNGTVGGGGVAGSAACATRLPASRGATNTFRLAGTIIPNVSSYLHDADQPTADVFMVFKRSGSAAGPASLVVIAAWPPGLAGGGGSVTGGGSITAVANGAGGGGGGGASSLRLDVNAPPAITHAQAPMERGSVNGEQRVLKQMRALGLYGIGGGGTCVVNTSAISGTLSPYWDAATTAAGGSPGGPAFVVYLTSSLPLPTQLLCAARDRAMAMLEVLLPAASRALTGAVQDEWSYLCSQVGGGMVPGAGPLSGLGPEDTRDSMPAASGRTTLAVGDRAAMSHRSTGNGLAGGIENLMGLASSPAWGASPSASSAAQASNSRYGVAAAAAVTNAVAHAAAHTDSGSRGGLDGHHLVVTPYHSNDAAGPRGAGSDSAASNRGLVPNGRAGRGAGTGTTAGASAGGGGGGGVSGSFEGHLLLTGIPVNSNALGLGSLDEENQYSGTGLSGANTLRGAMATGGGGCGAGGGATAVLTTVLSDVRDAVKASRQQQLDIMVSTFQNTLSKARNDTGVLGGAHAEDDVRSLRLIKTIGQGGCSVVLLARLHAMPVAVKVILPPDDESDEEHSSQLAQPADAPQQYPQQGKAGPSASRGLPPQVLRTPPDTPTSAAADARVLPDSGGSIVLLTEKTNATPTTTAACHAAAVNATGAGGAGAWGGRSSVARQMRLRMLMRGARELAVMTSISHPAIVQVYSYCTRVVILENKSGVPQLEVVPEGAPAAGPLCTALIMEYCDMGSLADAIDSGTFTRAMKTAAAALYAAAKGRASQSVALGRTDRNMLNNRASQANGSGGGAGRSGEGDGGSGSISPGVARPAMVSPAVAATAGTATMRAIYLTLLEVALALRHLHSLHLVHCDVKPANVLLRSSATDPRGFTAKLTDFGFVNLMDQQQQEANSKTGPESEAGGSDSCSCSNPRFQEPVGTVTHMAPELFVKGNVVDASIDVYAFGILMWELCTGRAPYPEYAEGQFLEVPYKVVKEGLRPRFPPDTPMHYKLLAQECWASQPARRPSAAALVSKLQHLLDLSCGFTQPGRGGW